MFAILKKTGVPDDSDRGMQDIADLSGQEEEMMTAAATSSNRDRDIALLISTATNVSPAGVPWGAYSWFKDIKCQPTIRHNLRPPGEKSWSSHDLAARLPAL